MKYHNTEIESAILSSVLTKPELIESVITEISPQDFELTESKILLWVIYKLHRENKPIDLDVIIDTLKKGKKYNQVKDHLIDIMEAMGHSTGLPYYIEQIKEGKKKGTVAGLIEKLNRSLNSEYIPVDNAIQDIIETLNKLGSTGSQRPDNVAQEVRDWASTTSGYFLTAECYRELSYTTFEIKRAATVALLRLVESGVIEKHGDKRGCYRRIEQKPEVQEWWTDEGTPIDLRWPLGIETYANLYPGNVVLLEGAKSQGKSAFAIDFCRMNHKKFPGAALYQNIEMATSELRQRFNSYGDLFPYEEAMKAIEFIRVNDSWWDYILPDGLNVIDYLVQYDKSYILPQYIRQIHEKLNNGIALVLVQRDAFKPYGTGGRGVRDFPRLVLSLMAHKLKLEDVKSFKNTGIGNPTGLCIEYKHVNYCELHPASDWYFAEEEKYKDFNK